MTENKNYYNISFPRLALLLLPTMLRKDLLLSFVTALVRPLTIIQSKFNTYRLQLNTSVESQVCCLEYLLNDTYDYYERRIIVRDAPINYDDFFVFDFDTDKAVLLSDNEEPAEWVDSGNMGTTNADFEVVFPRGYSLSDNEQKALKQLIKNNKLASKKYNIVYE